MIFGYRGTRPETDWQVRVNTQTGYIVLAEKLQWEEALKKQDELRAEYLKTKGPFLDLAYPDKKWGSDHQASSFVLKSKIDCIEIRRG